MKSTFTFRQYITLENAAIAALCIMAFFSKSKNMTDSLIVPRQLFTALTLSIVVIILAFKGLFSKRIKIDPLAWSVIITTVSAVEAAYALFQFCIIRLLGLDMFVTGSFDNPVGLMSSLCLSLPFALYAATASARWKKSLVGASVLIFLAILTSESRAGILAAVLVLLCYGLRFTTLSKTKSLLVVLGSGAFLVGASCLINTASVSGRLLIWHAAWPLIAATPFCGYGTGAFQRFYMAAQADYLRAFSPDSDYAMLAGNSIVPFNEYIDFYMNYGAFGAVMLIGFTVAVIFIFVRNRDSYKSFAMLALGALAFISLFSYPFTYASAGVIAMISVILIFKGSFSPSLPSSVKASVAIALIVSGGYCSYWAIDRIDAEMSWGKALRNSDLTAYADLKPRLEHVPHFSL